MHTSLPTWLALSAATIIPSVSAFYPYQYDAVNVSPSPPRAQRLSRASNDNTGRTVTLPLRRIAMNLQSRQSNAYSIVSSKKPNQDKSVAIDQDGKDLSYMVAVTFGDSKEEYHMLLDSAASNTWVMGQECKSEACKTHSLFGKGDSSTLKTDDTKSFSMTYGTGSASGTLASDTIHLGSTLSSPLTFGLASNVSDEFRAYPMDGILGIGRGSAKKHDGEIDAPQIMDVLRSSELIPSKLYGISLSRAKDSLNDGSLDIGHIDKSRFSGDLNYLECVDNDTGFWEIPLQGASVDGKDAGLSTASRTAIIDTGTSFILIPSSDASAIHAPIKGMTQNGESFFVPCDTTTSLALSFNNQSYNISTKDWIGDKAQGDGRNLCRSNIIGRQTFGEHQWLVGDVFLKNVYAVFDFEAKKVGFGVKSNSSDDAGAAETSSSSSSAGEPTASASGVARPSVTAAAEKAPQNQASGSMGTADLSSSGLALVVAFGAVLWFV